MQSYSPVKSRFDLRAGRDERGSTEGKTRMGNWSPAPVVYGKVNRKLSQKSQSIPRRLLLLLSSRPQHDGSTGGSERAEEHSEGGRGRLEIWASRSGKLEGMGGVAALFYPWVMSQFWATVPSLIIWQQIETV